MASINRVILAGRLTRDPELKEIKPGLNVCKFSLATDYTYRGKETQEKEVCFTDVNVWFKLADLCAASLKKGTLVTVEGRLKMEKWTDKAGNERSRHIVVAENVVFMEPRQESIEFDVAADTSATQAVEAQRDKAFDKLMGISKPKEVTNVDADFFNKLPF